MAKWVITVFFQTEQKIIYDELQYLREETRHAKSIDKIIALFNYFGELNKFFYHAFGKETKATLYCELDYNWYYDQLALFLDGLKNPFINSKDFHSWYIGEIYSILTKDNCSPHDYSHTFFSEEKFFCLLGEFLETYNIKELFNDIVADGRLYRAYTAELGGLNLCCPLNHKCKILLETKQLDVDAMECMVHEIGHAYYRSFAYKDMRHYNLSVYSQSLLSESLPIGFETLLLRFLLDRNMYVEEIKNIFLKRRLWSMESMEIVSSSSLSLEIIINNLIYAYGFILSFFFVEAALKDGLNNSVTRFIIEHRSNLFDGDLLLEQGFTPDNFAKVYTKHFEMFKK